MVKLTLGLLPLGHPHHPRRGHVRRLRSHRPKDLRVHEGEKKAVGIFLWRPQQRVQQERRGKLQLTKYEKNQNRQTDLQRKVTRRHFFEGQFSGKIIIEI